MIQQPNMVIIGAAGRNVGKTEFACELIQRYHDTENVIGVKITSIKEKDGQCPRGGAGCGVCSSLVGNFMITEETVMTGPKDTVRMLKAGAKKVFWLRVLHEALEEGMQALFEQIPPDACIVCESNSSRTVTEPGLFLVVKEQGNDTIKETCQAVLPYADQIITFDGNGWDFQPAQINFEQNRWQIPARRKGAAQ